MTTAIMLAAAFNCLAATWLDVAKPASVMADGAPDARVEVLAQPDGSARVRVASASPLTFVRLRWNASVAADARLFGGDWERTYGDSGWKGRDGAGAMPWYFLASSGGVCNAAGVKVQPNAFASWAVADDFVELVLDCRAGSDPVELGGRTLDACTIVSRRGGRGEPPFEAARAFARMMCDSPRLPNDPVYGYNDWYCAYGRNSATNFLADARAVLALADGLKNRPFAVADDGWQAADTWRDVNARWAMPMEKVAERIREMDARPGLWYRPLRGFPDPTMPAVERTVRGDIATFRQWGYELLKIDFITYDWCRAWNPKGPSPVVRDDIHWADRSRTSAEVVRGLYAAMRDAAGEGVTIIGCNAIDHFAAGLFEVQRTGDDTSGCDWDLTAKCGPNALGMRAHHHGAFYVQDGDCAGLSHAGAVDWAKNEMWIDLLSRSGGAFFVSWRRRLLDGAASDALRAAFARASAPQEAAVAKDWMERTSPEEWLCGGEARTYRWFAGDEGPSRVTRFLVIGDVHYCNVDDNGDPAEARMERLAADLKKKGEKFDFVIQVGDLVNCQTGYTPRAISECHAEWVHAIAEVKRLFPDKPFLTTPGNHDWYGGDSWQGGGPCIRQHYIPFMERELGAPLNGLPFFTFRANDVMFVFINHFGMERGLDIECRKMVRKALAAADADPSVSRVFAVSHPELWNVDYFRFNENAELLPEFMAARKFDAYFSGHVHMNNVTARKNDYGFALRQICSAGVWPPCKEPPERFHAVPTMRLNPPPSQTLFADFPADVESYTVVEASREKVAVRFEAVGGGTLAEYAWRGVYDLEAVKKASPRFDATLPARPVRARLYYFPLFTERVLGAGPAPRFVVNGRDIGEMKRNFSFFHTNWGGFFVDLPPGVVRRENAVEILNPSGDKFLVRDLAIMAAGEDGVEHFTPVHPKMLSFGDPDTFYMGFGLVHENTGIIHSGLEANASAEVVETVPRGARSFSLRLDFTDGQGQ